MQQWQSRSLIQCFQHQSKGLTLIELLVGVVIVSIIAGAAGASLISGLKSREIVESHAELLQTARTTMRLIERDLRDAVPLSEDFEFVGMDRELGDIPADNLDFATRNFDPQAPGERDLCEVSYFVDKARDGKGYALYRRTDPTVDDFPLEGGFREQVINGVKGFSLEYYDGFSWYDFWGRQRQRVVEETERSLLAGNLTGMPDAVRVTLILDVNREIDVRKGTTDPDLKPMSFETIVHLVNAEWTRWGSSFSTPNLDPDNADSENDEGEK